MQSEDGAENAQPRYPPFNRSETRVIDDVG